MVSNVIAFPGNQVPPNVGDYAITPNEICFLVSAHLALSITDDFNLLYFAKGKLSHANGRAYTPSAGVKEDRMAFYSFGVSDEGDGWFYADYECKDETNHYRRTQRNISRSPMFRVEKTAEGFRAKYYLRKTSQDEVQVPNVDGVIAFRFEPHQFAYTKVVYEGLVKNAKEIALEIQRYPERGVTVNGMNPHALRAVDYEFVNNLVDSTKAEQASQMSLFEDILDG